MRPKHASRPINILQRDSLKALTPKVLPGRLDHFWENNRIVGLPIQRDPPNSSRERPPVPIQVKIVVEVPGEAQDVGELLREDVEVEELVVLVEDDVGEVEVVDADYGSVVDWGEAVGVGGGEGLGGFVEFWQDYDFEVCLHGPTFDFDFVFFVEEGEVFDPDLVRESDLWE